MKKVLSMVVLFLKHLFLRLRLVITLGIGKEEDRIKENCDEGDHIKSDPGKENCDDSESDRISSEQD